MAEKYEKVQDTIRQGVVSSINYEEGRVRVLYKDKNEVVTAELPLQSFEYDMPRVGEQIYVAHQSNGVEKAAVLSRYFCDNEMPVESGWHIWRKELRDGGGKNFTENDSFFRFNRKTHTLTINVVDSPEISVDVIAAKDVNVTTKGSVNVKADESVTVNAGKDVTVEAGTEVNVTAGSDVTVKAGGDATVEAGGKITVKSGGDMTLESGGNMTIKSGGNMTIKGEIVSINE